MLQKDTDATANLDGRSHKQILAMLNARHNFMVGPQKYGNIHVIKTHALFKTDLFLSRSVLELHEH